MLSPSKPENLLYVIYGALNDEKIYSSSVDNKIDIDGGVNLEGGNVLDDRGWANDINNSLVDSHLISVPSVCSLTAWRFSRCHSQDLRGHSNWSPGFITLVLVLGSCDHLVARRFQMLNLSSLELYSVNKQKMKK